MDQETEFALYWWEIATRTLRLNPCQAIENFRGAPGGTINSNTMDAMDTILTDVKQDVEELKRLQQQVFPGLCHVTDFGALLTLHVAVQIDDENKKKAEVEAEMARLQKQLQDFAKGEEERKQVELCLCLFVICYGLS